MLKTLILLISFNISIVTITRAQTSFPLYEDGIVPGSIPTTILNDTLPGTSWITGHDTTIIKARTIMPTLTVFPALLDKSNRTAVIICSGGAYRNVADAQEGYPAAQRLAASGINAFVLHYRVPRSDLMINKTIAPSQDVQKAIQFVREHAKTYNFDPNKLGLMGFSAGGHLVSTIGTHPNDVYIDNPNHTDLIPNFLVLVYPVISFADSITHKLSRQNLIGPDITDDKIKKYSNELQVSTQTPPTFITHAIDDDVVKVDNTLYFYSALQQAKVPAEIFLYSKGGHGFGIQNETAHQQWIDVCINWILTNWTKNSKSISQSTLSSFK